MEVRTRIPLLVALFLIATAAAAELNSLDHHQPLAQIAIHRSRVLLATSASISATPSLLGSQGEVSATVRVTFTNVYPSSEDWVGVFSPADFSSKLCPNTTQTPSLCSAPIKFQYATYSNANYTATGRGSLDLGLINQRSDFAFGLFSGGLQNPVLLAVSRPVKFANPKAPVSPRIALSKNSDEITITWTSGYSLKEARPFVTYKHDHQTELHAPAATLTFTKNDLCGPPAKTVGWRDPGFIHTSYLKNLWPSTKYSYRVGHRLRDGSVVYGERNSFMSPPSQGEDSVQRVIIFGDMGKAERDHSNEYSNFEPGALNTTDRLLEDLNNYDIVFNIGDLSYSDGYISQWDQFLDQVGGISKAVPFMVASGNHERDWPLSGSFFNSTDSGGECGVPAQTLYNMPAKNRANFWYSADYGMFRFCVADSEHDWRVGTEQYAFLEECMASVDRQKQPWLIFMAHRVLGYSSGFYYADQGTFAEPLAREALQNLWQKYKVDIAFYGHVHNYERTCPVFENVCVGNEKSHFTGKFNATIHVVTGGGGAILLPFTPLNTTWSVFKDFDYGFTKLTAFNHSSLLFEYKRSSTGAVHDSFRITREYQDVLGCDSLGRCPEVQLVR